MDFSCAGACLAGRKRGRVYGANREHRVKRWIDSYARWVWHPGKWRVAVWLYRHYGHAFDTDLEVERAGLRWRLDPADYVSCDLFWCGIKDRWELYHLMRLLPADAVIADVGANFGYYACMLGSRLGAGCRGYAFEPFNESYVRLCHNVKLNGLQDRIEPIEAALSDQVGTCRMQAYADNTAAAHVAGAAGSTLVTTLDSILAERGIRRMDFVKIDAEGLEMHVLRGGRGTIQDCRPVLLVEVHPGTLKRHGSAPADLVAALRERDYRLFRIVGRRLVPLTDGPVISDYFNVLCLPNSKTNRILR